MRAETTRLATRAVAEPRPQYVPAPPRPTCAARAAAIPRTVAAARPAPASARPPPALTRRHNPSPVRPRSLRVKDPGWLLRQERARWPPTGHALRPGQEPVAWSAASPRSSRIEVKLY